MQKTQEIIRRNSSFWTNLFKSPTEKSDLEDLFLSIPLFEDLGTKYLKLLMKIVHNRVYEPNEYIFYQGDPGIGLYIVVEGEISITQSLDGEKVLELARLSRGDFFGELALLDDEVRSGSAIATKPTTLAVLFKPDLDEFIEQYPKKGIEILRGISVIISTRLRTLNKELFNAYKNELNNEEVNDGND